MEDAEDEKLLLRAGLTGYVVTFASSVKDAILLLERNSFSLIVLDLTLEDGDGIDVLAAARGMEKYIDIPILILSGSKGLKQKTAAFALGADDYLEKPCDHREIKLRIDAKLRRFEQLSRDKEILRIGGLLLDVQGQTLKREADEKAISLTSMEFRILYALAKRPGKIFSRESLIEIAWGGNTVVDTRTVDSHVANLRKKVSAPGLQITTVIGSGYKLSTE